ncbi:hypothetical protein Daus18300_007321 [Diaporthe australafricana]|uniref:Uncharacterized protein n=1 Tax=Diaporthe australafricana TaxID=127596 RepID=A0ABR3WNF9_9PEZI
MNGGGGGYFSACEEWHDPITPGSNDSPALRLESTTTKHADGRQVRGEGSYSAAEAAQDARSGASLIAWPAGEKWEMQPVSVFAVESEKTGKGRHGDNDLWEM